MKKIFGTEENYHHVKNLFKDQRSVLQQSQNPNQKTSNSTATTDFDQNPSSISKQETMTKMIQPELQGKQETKIQNKKDDQVEKAIFEL